MEAVKATVKIRVCEHIQTERDFADFYHLTNTTYGRGDFFELRQVVEKTTGIEKCAKIFRKIDFIDNYD